MGALFAIRLTGVGHYIVTYESAWSRRPKSGDVKSVDQYRGGREKPSTMWVVLRDALAGGSDSHELRHNG
jgi:hypothetical protein